MVWQKISVLGVGLLGGSLGLALKKRRLAKSVVGFVRRTSSVADCLALGVADTVTDDLAAAVTGADLVVLCTPLSQMPDLLRRMTPALRRGAIVTDVGSVKASVVRELEPLVHQAGAYFVGSHPMAGAEKVGVRAARADLFQDAVCAITPTENSNAASVEKIAAFWKSVGAVPLQMTAEQHDEWVSRTSHLPHVLAAALASYVLNPAFPKEQATLCATGFGDTTRIAAGDPDMWRDIALANRANLGDALVAVIEDLQAFRHVLEQNDPVAVGNFFAAAKQRRDQWRGRGAFND